MLTVITALSENEGIWKNMLPPFSFWPVKMNFLAFTSLEGFRAVVWVEEILWSLTDFRLKRLFDAKNDLWSGHKVDIRSFTWFNGLTFYSQDWRSVKLKSSDCTTELESPVHFFCLALISLGACTWLLCSTTRTTSWWRLKIRSHWWRSSAAPPPSPKTFLGLLRWAIGWTCLH